MVATQKLNIQNQRLNCFRTVNEVISEEATEKIDAVQRLTRYNNVTRDMKDLLNYEIANYLENLTPTDDIIHCGKHKEK